MASTWPQPQVEGQGLAPSQSCIAGKGLEAAWTGLGLEALAGCLGGPQDGVPLKIEANLVPLWR